MPALELEVAKRIVLSNYQQDMWEDQNRSPAQKAVLIQDIGRYFVQRLSFIIKYAEDFHKFHTSCNLFLNLFLVLIIVLLM